ncbi:MAG TPA: ABC transporter substrate-binding protein [Micropepsaceae bacterium]|nr:ABC transporter substrate-binding protein [Micropepsaceae bacterium]
MRLKTALKIGVLALTLSVALSCSRQDTLPLIVRVPALSISRLPYVIAQDQGLYKKYGLNVELWMVTPGAEDRVVVRADLLTRIWRAIGINTPQNPDVDINGGTPMMVEAMESARNPHRIVIASTDCVVRAHLIGRRGIQSAEELKGKRIGVSALRATAGFHALLFAKRMGWDPVKDITIIPDAENVGVLLDNSVDAIFGYEREYAAAKRAGLPILADSHDWNDTVAGNSAILDSEWLKDPQHREAARRFLKALAEGIKLFRERPELAMGVMETWYGIKDKGYAKTLYERGAWIPMKPYPCYEGFKKTTALYDSNEMRKHSPDEFYDDSLMRELDASGFIDNLYR